MNIKNFYVKFYFNSFYEDKIKKISRPSGCFKTLDESVIFLKTEYNKLWSNLADLGVEIEKNTDIRFELSFKKSVDSDDFDKIICYDYCLEYVTNEKRTDLKKSTEKYDADLFDFIFGFCSCLQMNKLMIQ